MTEILVANGAAFSEAVERRIEAKEFPFKDQSHPFMVTAMRGLAARISGGEIEPQGFCMAKLLYAYDLEVGIDGFSREPMPHAVRIPQAARMMSLSLGELAEEAFGGEFCEAVKVFEDSVRNPNQE